MSLTIDREEQQFYQLIHEQEYCAYWLALHGPVKCARELNLSLAVIHQLGTSPLPTNQDQLQRLSIAYAADIKMLRKILRLNF